MFARPLLHELPRAMAAHVWLCALLLALACRAVIPAGYMPDRDAAREGTLVLAVCGVGGEARVGLSLPDGADPAPGRFLDAPPCPFGILAAQAPLPASAPARQSLAWQPQLPATPRTAAHGVARTVHGPPLGPRAPPFPASRV